MITSLNPLMLFTHARSCWHLCCQGWLMLSLLLTRTPGPPVRVQSVPLQGLLFPTGKALNLSLLNFTRFLLPHSSCPSRCLQMRDRAVQLFIAVSVVKTKSFPVYSKRHLELKIGKHAFCISCHSSHQHCK